MRDRIEGYWRTHYAPELPLPVIDVPWGDRDAFLERLAAVERVADRWQSKGWSNCRVCGCINGSAEYHLGGWGWPDGYAHYLRDHGVRPGSDFEVFILGVELSGLAGSS